MSYQSIWILKKNEILACAEKVKTSNPSAWEEVKVPGQKSRTFISLVAAECQKAVSATIGCNLKRGGPEVSLDVLAMPNDTGAVDATNTFTGLELIDIIAGAEGPNPSLVWGDATQKTIDAGVPGGWIKAPTPQPEPSPTTVQSYPSESPDGGWWGQVADVQIAATYARKQQPYPSDQKSLRWIGRIAYDIRDGMTKEESLAKHIKELEQELGL